jgi:hypothetical protein
MSGSILLALVLKFCKIEMTHKQIANKKAMNAKYMEYLAALAILDTVKFSQIMNYGSNPS